MASTSRTKNSLLNLLATFGQQLLNIILRFAVRTVFVYTLGKSYLGINTLFADILSMLSLAELGFDTAINFKLYKPLLEHDEKAIRMYLEFFKQVYRIVSAVIFVLGISLIPALPLLIKNYEKLDELGINAVLIYVIYLLQSVSSYLFFAYRSAIIKADQRSYLIYLVKIFSDIVKSITQIVILLCLQDYILYIIVLIVFNVLQNLVFARMAVKRYPRYFLRLGEHLPKQERLEIFKDCSALFLFKADNMVLKATDNLLLSAVEGLTVVGEYSTYLMLYSSCRGILIKLFESFKDSMGNLFAEESRERKYAFFEITNFLTIILYGTAGIAIAAVSNELIECWLGADYVIPQPLPTLIGIELLFLGIKTNLNQTRNVSGVFRQVWYRPVMGIFINLAVSIIGALLWGISGVVLGTIASMIFANFTVDPAVIHKYTFEGYMPVSRYYKKNLGYIAVLAIIYTAVMCLFRYLAVGYGWVSVIVHGLLCGLLVPTILLLVYSRTRECRYLFRKVQLIFDRRGKQV